MFKNLGNGVEWIQKEFKPFWIVEYRIIHYWRDKHWIVDSVQGGNVTPTEHYALPENWSWV